MSLTIRMQDLKFEPSCEHDISLIKYVAFHPFFISVYVDGRISITDKNWNQLYESCFLPTSLFYNQQNYFIIVENLKVTVYGFNNNNIRKFSQNMKSFIEKVLILAKRDYSARNEVYIKKAMVFKDDLIVLFSNGILFYKENHISEIDDLFVSPNTQSAIVITKNTIYDLFSNLQLNTKQGYNLESEYCDIFIYAKSRYVLVYDERVLIVNDSKIVFSEVNVLNNDKKTKYFFVKFMDILILANTYSEDFMYIDLVDYKLFYFEDECDSLNLRLNEKTYQPQNIIDLSGCENYIYILDCSGVFSFCTAQKKEIGSVCSVEVHDVKKFSKIMEIENSDDSISVAENQKITDSFENIDNMCENISNSSKNANSKNKDVNKNISVKNEKKKESQSILIENSLKENINIKNGNKVDLNKNSYNNNECEYMNGINKNKMDVNKVDLNEKILNGNECDDINTINKNEMNGNKVDLTENSLNDNECEYINTLSEDRTISKDHINNNSKNKMNLNEDEDDMSELSETYNLSHSRESVSFISETDLQKITVDQSLSEINDPNNTFFKDNSIIKKDDHQKIIVFDDSTNFFDDKMNDNNIFLDSNELTEEISCSKNNETESLSGFQEKKDEFSNLSVYNAESNLTDLFENVEIKGSNIEENIEFLENSDEIKDNLKSNYSVTKNGSENSLNKNNNNGKDKKNVNYICKENDTLINMKKIGDQKELKNNQNTENKNSSIILDSKLDFKNEEFNSKINVNVKNTSKSTREVNSTKFGNTSKKDENNFNFSNKADEDILEENSSESDIFIKKDDNNHGKLTSINKSLRKNYDENKSYEKSKINDSNSNKSSFDFHNDVSGSKNIDKYLEKNKNDFNFSSLSISANKNNKEEGINNENKKSNIDIKSIIEEMKTKNEKIQKNKKYSENNESKNQNDFMKNMSLTPKKANNRNIPVSNQNFKSNNETLTSLYNSSKYLSENSLSNKNLFFNGKKSIEEAEFNKNDISNKFENLEISDKNIYEMEYENISKDIQSETEEIIKEFKIIKNTTKTELFDLNKIYFEGTEDIVIILGKIYNKYNNLENKDLKKETEYKICLIEDLLDQINEKDYSETIRFFDHYIKSLRNKNIVVPFRFYDGISLGIRTIKNIEEKTDSLHDIINEIEKKLKIGSVKNILKQNDRFVSFHEKPVKSDNLKCKGNEWLFDKLNINKNKEKNQMFSNNLETNLKTSKLAEKLDEKNVENILNKSKNSEDISSNQNFTGCEKTYVENLSSTSNSSKQQDTNLNIFNNKESEKNINLSIIEQNLQNTSNFNPLLIDSGSIQNNHENNINFIDKQKFSQNVPFINNSTNLKNNNPFLSNSINIQNNNLFLPNSNNLQNNNPFLSNSFTTKQNPFSNNAFPAVSSNKKDNEQNKTEKKELSSGSSAFSKFANDKNRFL